MTLKEVNDTPGAHTSPLEVSRPASAEQRLRELGIKLPPPPEPFGTYVEAVLTGNLRFLSGMLPTQGHEAKFIGRVGAELDVDGGRKAAQLAALNALAVARQHLGSLDRVTRVVRLGVSVATSGDVREQPKILGEPERYQKDVPSAEVHVLDTGHFALDTKADEIASLVSGFMKTRK